MKFPDKKRGKRPIYDHSKIKELLKKGEAPIKIMALFGCSYGVIRYIRNKIRCEKK